MKVAIYNQDYNGKLAGAIFDLLENKEEINKFYTPLLDEGVVEVIDIPEDVSIEYLKIENQEGNWVAVEDVARKQTRQLKNQAAKLKADMNKELYDLMYDVAGTRDYNSAKEYEKTWNNMIADPSRFVNAGLTARFDRGEDIDGNPVLVGDLLDTEEKITSYAQECLDLVAAGEITRLQRIEQYKQDIAALYASASGSV
jgi:hydrogenase maturation factor